MFSSLSMLGEDEKEMALYWCKLVKTNLEGDLALSNKIKNESTWERENLTEPTLGA